MSDIHGLYDRYLKVLDTINFSDEDYLYILGDVIDRGPQSFEILFDIMDRKNVELFLGNHEHMMLTYIKGLDYRTWFYDANGGRRTYHDFINLSDDDQNKIIDYLWTTTLYKELNINNHKYILSHTSALLSNVDLFTKDFRENIMEVQDFVWNEYPYDIDGLAYEDKIDEEITLISGHIITRRLHESDEIYIRDFNNGYKWIDIDCGCAIGQNLGYLACLAINDAGEIENTIYIQ